MLNFLSGLILGYLLGSVIGVYIFFMYVMPFLNKIMAQMHRDEHRRKSEL